MNALPDSFPIPETRLPANGAQALIASLLALGVDTVFGYPGGAVLPLYDALHGEPRLRHVLVRHEQAAVHAAEGYARSSGRAGVVFVTSGPGMSNTTTGLLDALCDSIPVLCISGQVATTAIGTDAFQECDALGISRPVTKWNVQIRSVEQVAVTVEEGYRRTREGRPGPVLIDFPKDIQLQALPAAAWQAPELQSLVPGPPDPQAIAAALDLLQAAQRPVFYGGGGLINSGAAACASFQRLVRASGAPCTLTLMGLGAFPAASPQWLGMLGMHGSLEANLAMHHADLIVCVGARFDDRVTGRLDSFCPGARIIHLDIDPRSIGKVLRADVALPGDCADTLAALERGWQARGPEPGSAGLVGPNRQVARGGQLRLRGQRHRRHRAPGLDAPAAAGHRTASAGAGRHRRHRCGPASDVGSPASAVPGPRALAELRWRWNHGLWPAGRDWRAGGAAGGAGGLRQRRCLGA